MTQNKINKLELTWIGKNEKLLAVEPRLLLDTPEYSFGEIETGTLPNGKPWPGNMLIHGDNLLALRALEDNFAGQVKCIYIDPPYNTGNDFVYNDSFKQNIDEYKINISDFFQPQYKLNENHLIIDN